MNKKILLQSICSLAVFHGLIFLILIGVSDPVSAVDYFVAPDGSDLNPGTLAQPFATPEKARDTLRTLNFPQAFFGGNPAWVTGIKGNALNFDGFVDYLSTPAVRLFGQPSIAMWVKFTAANPGVVVVRDYPLICQDNGTTKPETYVGFQWNKGVLSLKADFYFNGVNASEAVLPLDAAAVIDQWMHIVVTYDSTRTRIYVNGDERASSAVSYSNPMRYSWLPWTIGARPVALWTSAYFQGVIDEVRIYNRALTAAEVSSLAGTVGTGPTAGLEHYWKFDEGIGRAAQDEIKRSFTGATVYFRNGTYDRTQSFDLGAEDSGGAGSAIIYRAYGDEKVIWNGAKALPTFQPVTDISILNRFDAGVRDHVQQIDLKGLGITYYGLLHGRENFYPADNSNAIDLYFQDQPMTLARWPNKGNGWEKVDPMIPEYTYDNSAVIHPLPIVSISNTTPAVVTTAVNHYLQDNDSVVISSVACSARTFSIAHSPVTVLSPVSFSVNGSVAAGDCPGNTGGVTPICKFRYRTNRPDRWVIPQDIWVHGYFSVDYKDYREKVALLDRTTKTIRTDFAEAYGLEKPWKYKGTQGGRFYYENVLEELDSPGEWYLDRSSGILYFWPPADLQAGNAEVSMLTAPFVTMSNVAYVSFQGIEFSKGRSAGIRINGGGNNTIRGCRIHNLNADGITIDRSVQNTVNNCEIGYTSSAGISLNAGDRRTLAYGDNLISNNEIYHFGRVAGLKHSAVDITGVGNRVEHNLIHDGPNSGITISGNDQVVAYNEIYHVGQEASEIAGIFTNGNLYTIRGTKIMYNYIHDIVPDSGVAFPLEFWGIATDGLPMEQTIIGNILVDLPRNLGLSGRDSIISNNIVYNAHGYPGFTVEEFTDSAAITALITKITSKGISMPGGFDDIDKLNNLLRTPGLRNMVSIPQMPSQAAELLTRDTSLSEYALMQLNRFILYKLFPQCPQGRFGVVAVQWANHLPQHFDGTPPTDPTIYNDLLYYNYKYPPYSTHYPALATTWEDQPAHAKYNKILKNILITPNPLDLMDAFTRNEDFNGNPADASYTAMEIGNNFTSGDPMFRNNPPKVLADFELQAHSPVWALGFQRIPIEQIGLMKTQTSGGSGDVSGDGRVSMYDAALTLQYTLGGSLTPVQQVQADINGDAAIDAEDAMAVAKKALKF